MIVQLQIQGAALNTKLENEVWNDDDFDGTDQKFRYLKNENVAVWQ